MVEWNLGCSVGFGLFTGPYIECGPSASKNITERSSPSGTSDLCPPSGHRTQTGNEPTIETTGMTTSEWVHHQEQVREYEKMEEIRNQPIVEFDGEFNWD
ncbi:hypothetical protein KU306_12105 [Haloferax larsenii]|uniref:Uncharacterized protein n=1 Tax=Haloferax larsenii TaxID=302484 RepID=A0ABY5RBC4_HALLR|nr:hypothetical protein [Haloferax larsenii]UVE49647.1 hypothetical protein KU306_12105 [Haloferax larsenii]